MNLDYLLFNQNSESLKQWLPNDWYTESNHFTLSCLDLFFCLEQTYFQFDCFGCKSLTESILEIFKYLNSFSYKKEISLFLIYNITLLCEFGTLISKYFCYQFIEFYCLDVIQRKLKNFIEEKDDYFIFSPTFGKYSYYKKKILISFLKILRNCLSINNKNLSGFDIIFKINYNILLNDSYNLELNFYLNFVKLLLIYNGNKNSSKMYEILNNLLEMGILIDDQQTHLNCCFVVENFLEICNELIMAEPPKNNNNELMKFIKCFLFFLKIEFNENLNFKAFLCLYSLSFDENSKRIIKLKFDITTLETRKWEDKNLIRLMKNLFWELKNNKIYEINSSISKKEILLLNHSNDRVKVNRLLKDIKKFRRHSIVHLENNITLDEVFRNFNISNVTVLIAYSRNFEKSHELRSCKFLSIELFSKFLIKIIN